MMLLSSNFTVSKSAVGSETVVVFHRCAQVETRFRSGVPHAAVVSFDVCLDCASDWGERFPHVIVVAMDVGKCQYLWCCAGLTQKIQGEFCWFK